jgi:hypothetical protein
MRVGQKRNINDSRGRTACVSSVSWNALYAKINFYLQNSCNALMYVAKYYTFPPLLA